jgi:hypothetical protein
MARRSGAQPPPHVGAAGGSSLSVVLHNARKSGALDLSDRNLVALPVEAFHLEELPQPPAKVRGTYPAIPSRAPASALGQSSPTSGRPMTQASLAIDAETARALHR